MHYDKVCRAALILKVCTSIRNIMNGFWIHLPITSMMVSDHRAIYDIAVQYRTK